MTGSLFPPTAVYDTRPQVSSVENKYMDVFSGDRQLKKHLCPVSFIWKDCSTSSCGPLTPDSLAKEVSKWD